MAAITDPQVLRYCNETIRPLAERLRDLDVLNEEAIANWYAQIDPLLSGNVAADTIEDGRDAEGISRLTLGDVQNFLTIANQLKTALDAAGKRDVVRKPTVRTVRV